MRGGMLMWREKVVTGLLLVMLLITLTNCSQEGEEDQIQKLPRPSVVRGEILTTPTSTSIQRELGSYCIMNQGYIVCAISTKQRIISN